VAAINANESLVMVMVVLGFLGVGYLVGESLFQYSVLGKILVIKLFGLLPVRRIDLQRVKQATTIRLWDWTPFSGSSKASYLWCERWGGFMLLFRGVAIALEGGKTGLIAPRNRGKFIDLIQAEIGRLSINPQSRATDSEPSKPSV
jgi:hypothetical protein